jgi:DNA-binding transcriptional regulator YiaG
MTIKEMRTRTGLTQAQFAQLLGIPKRSVENWERGVSRCPDYVTKLIHYFLEHEGTYKEV